MKILAKFLMIIFLMNSLDMSNKKYAFIDEFGAFGYDKLSLQTFRNKIIAKLRKSIRKGRISFTCKNV